MRSEEFVEFDDEEEGDLDKVQGDIETNDIKTQYCIFVASSSIAGGG
jgi:hypothetical protein